MAEISGAQLVVESLRREGVDTVYVLPGDPVGDIVNGCADRVPRHRRRRCRLSLVRRTAAPSWTVRHQPPQRRDRLIIYEWNIPPASIAVNTAVAAIGEWLNTNSAGNGWHLEIDAGQC